MLPLAIPGIEPMAATWHLPVLARLWSVESDMAGSGWTAHFLVPLIQALLVLAVIGLLLAGLMGAVYYLFSLPLRRREQTRLLLDLIELGHRQGCTPEEVIVAAARTGEPGLGGRFRELAARIESGERLSAALAGVPNLAPAGLRAMFETGEKCGDPGRVLDASRRFLPEGISRLVKAQNYLVVLALGIVPAWSIVSLVFLVFVMPKFVEIMHDMDVEATLWMGRFLRWTPWVVGIQWMISGAFLLGVAAYVAGPRLAEWCVRRAPGWAGRIAWCVPWRRQRMLRDFSGALGLMLDGGAPEAEAVCQAARCAANAVISKAAGEIVRDLERGLPLPQALEHIPDAGELGWRLRNAAAGRGGFVRALEGWHEALEARAYHCEQGYAQALTTALVLFNGVLVLGLALVCFLPLIRLIEEAILW